jgi:hypothetical protein
MKIGSGRTGTNHADGESARMIMAVYHAMEPTLLALASSQARRIANVSVSKPKTRCTFQSTSKNAT